MIIAEFNLQLGTVGEWVSGIGAALAVWVGWRSIRDAREEHRATLEEMQKQRQDAARLEAMAAKVAADEVVFVWAPEFNGGPYVYRFAVRKLENAGLTHFYDVHLHAEDIDGQQRGRRHRILTALPPRHEIGHTGRVNATSHLGEGTGVVKSELGLELTADDDPFPIELVLTYRDLAGRTWRKLRGAPAELVE